MRDIMHAIIFGFKEILRWPIMKMALIAGVIVSAAWVGIGFLLWDHFVTFSSHVIELIPFSMVRSNGAWMLSTFLWFQLVLLTFSLIFAFFGNFILRNVPKDKYTYFVLMVALSSTLFGVIVWWFQGDYIYHQFLQLLTWLPFETIEKGVAYLIGLYLIYNAIVVTMVFVVSALSEPLMIAIDIREDLDEDIILDNDIRSIRYTIKDTALFFLASLISFPLLFVPVVNFFVQIFLWIWLIKDTFRYDAASLLFKEIDKKKLQEHNKAVWMIGFVTALFNFVPVLNIFGPFFGEITMFHYLNSKKTINV